MVGYQSGNPQAARELIQKAIAAHPNVALYHSNLGVVLNAMGEFDQSVESYQRAIALDPNYVDALSNLANSLVARGKIDAAMPYFQRVLQLNPKHTDGLVNLGVAFAEQGQTDKAIGSYERAIELNPKCAEAFSNLGNAQQTLHRLDEAIQNYEKALALKPNYLTALYNYGNARQAQNRFGDAVECYERALKIDPKYVQAAYGEALAQLVQGDFANGWKNYETRWTTEGHKAIRAYAQPRWGGEHVEGNVLIWPEQGVGDEIMFAGLIPDVVRSGVRCTLECDERLRSLFARSFPSVKVIPSGACDSTEFAAHQPIGSLPGLFRNSFAAFGNTTSPYLVADPAETERLRVRYACGKLLVGIAWHTKNAKTGHHRSIDLSLLRPLLDCTNVKWISLQYGEHDNIPAEICVDAEVDQMSNMDLFAAQVAAMDLVITIDNSTAHLAGALGIPVWLLLPYARDWRWLNDRTDSPWYPTMRILRQPSLADWNSVIETAAKELANLDSSRIPGRTSQLAASLCHS